MPQVTVGGAVRYFSDPLPIGLAADGSCLFLCLLTTPVPRTFRTFLGRDAALLGALPSWRLRLLAPNALWAARDGYTRAFQHTLGTLAAGDLASRLTCFTVTTDNGSRLWVDGQLKIDRWDDQPPATFTVDIDLAAGAHTVRYEYYECWAWATAHLSWAEAPPATLGPNETLYPGDSRISADGRYTLTYQGDGNLVVYRQDWSPAWWSGTWNAGRAVMQDDGNFVVYNGDGWAVWDAGTAGHPEAWLLLANDEMVIYAASGARLRTWGLLGAPDAVAALVMSGGGEAMLAPERAVGGHRR